MTLDLWRDRDQEALAAQQSEFALNRFVMDNRRFIIRCASKACRRFITESDDEYEIALVAFCEAVKQYKPESGSFNGFAALVIRRRLMDEFDKNRRRKNEVLMGSAMTWDEEEAPAGAMNALQKKLSELSLSPEHTVKDEIEAVSGILKEYGFTFFDVAEASPKSTKTKGFCAKAVNWMLALVQRILKMRQRHSLPVTDISRECDISTKVLDRHRRYIIAATEILDGDFPQLQEYLQYIKRFREP